MPVTASNGFDCLEKTWRSTSKSGFLGCQSSYSKEILESVDSNCVLDSGFATLWIFPFGSHVVFYV